MKIHSFKYLKTFLSLFESTTLYSKNKHKLFIENFETGSFLNELQKKWQKMVIWMFIYSFIWRLHKVSWECKKNESRHKIVIKWLYIFSLEF